MLSSLEVSLIFIFNTWRCPKYRGRNVVVFYCCCKLQFIIWYVSQRVRFFSLWRIKCWLPYQRPDDVCGWNHRAGAAGARTAEGCGREDGVDDLGRPWWKCANGPERLVAGLDFQQLCLRRFQGRIFPLPYSLGL